MTQVRSEQFQDLLASAGPMRYDALMVMRPLRLILFAAWVLPAPALAQATDGPANSGPSNPLPQSVRDMIEAAIATGDKGKVDTIVEIARQTNPGALDEIEKLHRAFLDRQSALAAKKAADDEARIRSAGLFDRWKGKGELGASRATGTNDDFGLTAAIALDRKGIDWTHKLRGQVDYQRTNGTTSRERYFASYEPHYTIHKGLFTYALVQFESDRIQGYDERYTISGGFGYKLIDQDGFDLSIKGGPTFRYTRYESQPAESRLAALFGVDLGWQISPRIGLSQGVNAVAQGNGQALLILDSANTSINLVTALDTKISDHLTSRLSYEVNYNSNPPPAVVKTGTLSRFSIVYGF